MGVKTQTKELIADHLDVDISEVTDDAHLMDDLMADSLDLVDLLMQIEEEFDVEIQEKHAKKIKTVNDVLERIKIEMGEKWDIRKD